MSNGAEALMLSAVPVGIVGEVASKSSERGGIGSEESGFSQVLQDQVGPPSASSASSAESELSGESGNELPPQRSSSAASTVENDNVEGRLSTGGLVSEDGAAPEEGQTPEVTGRAGSLLFGSDIPRFASYAAPLARGASGFDSNSGIPASFYRLDAGAIPAAKLPTDLALNSSPAALNSSPGISLLDGTTASDAEIQLFNGQKLASSSLIAAETPETAPQQLAPRGLAAGQTPAGGESLSETGGIGRETADSEGSKPVTAERAAQDGLDALRRAVSGAEEGAVSKRTLTSQDAPGNGAVTRLQRLQLPTHGVNA